MALPQITIDRERQKFVEDSEGNTATRVVVDPEQVITLTPPVAITGAPVTVGADAVEMTFTGTTRVIALKAASTNTGLIWFGPSTVDNTGANAYGELTADSAVEIELNDASAAIYCVSDTASQKVYKVALT